MAVTPRRRLHSLCTEQDVCSDWDLDVDVLYSSDYNPEDLWEMEPEQQTKKLKIKQTKNKMFSSLLLNSQAYMSRWCSDTLCVLTAWHTHSEASLSFVCNFFSHTFPHCPDTHTHTHTDWGNSWPDPHRHHHRLRTKGGQREGRRGGRERDWEERGEKERGSGGSVWETQMGQRDGQNNDERGGERETGEGGREGECEAWTSPPLITTCEKSMILIQTINLLTSESCGFKYEKGQIWQDVRFKLIKGIFHLSAL